MQICHLIVVHKNPLQLKRLIKALQYQGSDIYVHVDKKADIQPFLDIQNDQEVVFKLIKNRISVNWGGYSFVQAIINSLKEIRNSGKQYDFISLISGQDYPIKNIEAFINFLQNSKHKCFISYDDTPNLEWWGENITRVTRYHFNDFPIKGKYFFQRLVNGLLPKREFPLKWKLYGGACSSWWTLSEEAAYYIVDSIENNKALKRYAKMTWTPDEYLYATILMNSKFKEYVVNDNYRYIDWSEKKPHPKILKSDDFSSLKNSHNFFARKFDLNVDEDILDQLDVEIGLR